MGVAHERHVVGVPVEHAFELWTNPRRWASFVDGFARVREQRGDWPQPGSQLLWESVPTGRGQVTEKVLEMEAPLVIVTEVFEEALTGRQTARFAAVEGEPERTDVRVELDYKLTKGGPLRVVSDVLFIRRALQDALGRTLVRFAREAEEERSLNEA